MTAKKTAGRKSRNSKKVRVGLIGVTDDELYVLDMGTIAEDAVPLAALAKMGPPELSKVALSTVKLNRPAAAGTGALDLAGPIAITAKFSDAFAPHNARAAAAIAQVIRTARNQPDAVRNG